MYGSDSEQLIMRPKEVYDGATPSGNSVSALNFLRLSRLIARNDLEEMASRQFSAFIVNLQRMARGHSFLLAAYLFSRSPSKEIVVVGDMEQSDTQSMLEAIKEKFRPFTLSMVYSDKLGDLRSIAPFIADYKTVDGRATAYVCQNFECQAPVNDSERFRKMLQH